MILALLLSPDGTQKIEINSWEVSIGRAKTSDIFLDNPTVSRFHAVIARRGKGWVIYDTKSKAGVSVNGTKIKKKAYIFDGDILTFGTSVMTFRSPLFKRPNADELPPVQQPTVPAYTEIPIAKTVVNKAKKQAKKPIPALVNLSDDSVILLFSDEYLIGRGAECDIILPVLTVSKNHAILTHEDGYWTLRDLESKGGTEINGNKLTTVHTMLDGDVIALGGVLYRFIERYMEE